MTIHLYTESRIRNLLNTFETVVNSCASVVSQIYHQAVTSTPREQVSTPGKGSNEAALVTFDDWLRGHKDRKAQVCQEVVRCTEQALYSHCIAPPLPRVKRPT